MTKIIDQSELYNNKNAKIGVLGGTFDPPHFAHIYMSNIAKKELCLDKVIFMPSGNPPHKNVKIVSNANYRLDMIELAIEDSEGYYIDSYEVYNNKPSYTVNSIKRIQKVLPKSSLLYFIIGADSLLYLDKWYDAKTLMKITKFAVIPRVGSQKSKCIEKIDELKAEYGAQITYIDCKPMKLSSTNIRKSIGEGEYSSTLIDEKVAKYIKENNLYKNV